MHSRPLHVFPRRASTGHRGLVAALVLASLLPAHDAAARRKPRRDPAAARPSPTEEARRLLALGIEHYSAGRYEEAVDAYRQSLALEPSPRVRVNLALALWKLGRADEAARELEDVLAASDLPAAVRERAQPLLDEVAASLTRLQLVVRGSGPITLDGAPLGAAPLERTVWLTPGHHTVAVGKHEETIDAAAGHRERLVLDASLVDVDAPLPAPPPPRRAGASRWRWVIPAGIAGAATISGIGFGLGARDAQRELDELNQHSEEHDFSAASRIADRGDRDALLANLSFAVAGVAALTTAWILFDDQRRDESLEVGFTPSSVAVKGRF